MFSFPIFVQRYLERLEAQFNLHKIPSKIYSLKEQCHNLDPLLIDVRLNMMYELAKDMLTNSEKI